MRGEFALIDWLRSQTSPDPRVETGIGDDAAVLVPPPGRLLATTDLLTEGVDFLLPPATPEQIGRKALAVNLSDLAAMAGLPWAGLVSLALPRQGGFELAQRLHAGWSPLAAEFDLPIVGGDTNSWDGGLVICITLLGRSGAHGAPLRSGARPGDWIFVTGELGGSLLGRQFDFTPRIREAQALAAAVELHALLDVSDGLVADLFHILDASRVGARLDADQIPISPAARRLAASPDSPAAVAAGAALLPAEFRQRTPLAHALADGEDFELVFTVSPADGRRLCESNPLAIPLTHIGEITAAPGCRLRHPDDAETPLERTGWSHPLK